MNFSLVLSGGAARGAFHLGVLQAIDELGIKIKYISGSSIGALIGASYASGVSPKEQIEIFNSKEFKKTIKFNYFRGSLARINYDEKLFNRLLPIKKLEDMYTKCFISTTDLIHGKNVIFDKGNTHKICMASCSIVPLFKPIYYDGKRLADGGITDNLPSSLLEQYSLPIIGVDLHPLNIDTKNSFLSLFRRAVFLLWKISAVENINRCDFYITDSNLSSYSMFKQKNFTQLYKMGYKAGMDYLNKL